MKNSSNPADKITRQDIQDAIEILNCYEVGTFVFYPCDKEYIHRIRDLHSNTILIGNTKRELYGKIHAFIEGVEQLAKKIANNLNREEEYDEDKEARDYEGGKEDYLYDNYVADQLESEE